MVRRHHQRVGILARRYVRNRRVHQRGARLDDHRTTPPAEPVLHETLDGLGDLPGGENREAARLDIDVRKRDEHRQHLSAKPIEYLETLVLVQLIHTVSMSALTRLASRRCAASTVLAAPVSAAVNSCSENRMGPACRAGPPVRVSGRSTGVPAALGREVDRDVDDL